jgi:hypothetical protein
MAEGNGIELNKRPESQVGFVNTTGMVEISSMKVLVACTTT